MKTLLLTLTALVSLATLAATNDTAKTANPTNSTNRQIDKSTNSPSPADRLRRRTGGLVLDRRVSKGLIAVFDCRTQDGSAALADYIERLESDLLLPVKCFRRAGAFKPVDAAAAMKDAKANFAVFIAECDCPMTLVTAPEQRFSIVNVKALAADKPGEERLTMRVRKEIARGIAFAFGSGYAVMGGGMAMPATSLAELDEVPAGSLSIETTSVIQRLAEERFGFKPYRKTFYVNALKEGWAPKPKGTYQKVLWEEYHAKPTQPMKIEFDPKSGK